MKTNPKSLIPYREWQDVKIKDKSNFQKMGVACPECNAEIEADINSEDKGKLEAYCPCCKWAGPLYV